MAAPRRLRHLWLGTVPYQEAWALQRRLAAARAAGEIDDCLLLLEHPPVYTVGRNAQSLHLGAGAEALRALGAECIEVDRGGSVTFHGPGQLVGYPILRLADAFPMRDDPERGDAVAYVRALEAALIATAGRHGIAAARRPGYTGAWVGGAKLAAIGVKLAAGVTQHGVALNVCTDLRWFSHVVPCGISDAGVTSMEREGVTGLTPEAVSGDLAAELAAAVGAEPVPAGTELERLVLAMAA
ncbi:MAG: lipoyl(octanoyl) transferase LipB [Candidatus Dormibacteria bacterium]